MPIDFPNSPTNGSTHTVGGTTWTYDGEKWNITSTNISGPQGATGATGPEGGSITLTTKGDLLTRSSSALVRQGVGANDTVLIADSAQTTGMKWAGLPQGSIIGPTPVSKGANYTLATTDVNFTVFEFTAAATLSVPTHASAAIPIGTTYTVVQMSGDTTSGFVTIAAVTPATTSIFSFLSTSAGSVKTRTRYSVASLYKRAQNEWLVYGDIRTV